MKAQAAYSVGFEVEDRFTNMIETVQIGQIFGVLICCDVASTGK